MNETSLTGLVTAILNKPLENSTLGTSTNSSSFHHSTPLEHVYLFSGALQLISLLCSLAVTVVYFLARRYSKDLVQRIGFKLTVLLSVSGMRISTNKAEALGSSFQLYGNRVYSLYPPSSPRLLFGCRAHLTIDLLFTLWSASLSFLIGYNLLRVFVYNEKRQGKILLPLYVILSICWAGVWTVPALFLDVYNWDETQATCWYTPPILSVLFYLPILICISISGVCTWRLIRKLRSTQSRNPYFDSITSSITSSSGNPLTRDRSNSQLFYEFQQREAFKIIDKLIARLFWY
jgi:hypothetical protein